MIRDTMMSESRAIGDAVTYASSAAAEAAQQVATCQGSVVLTGVGKAGWIAQKVVATLASTGSPSHFLHPSEAIHGDLGRVQETDWVIAFSNSGRSEEVVRACQYLQTQAAGLIAITADETNPLAELADLVVPMGRHREACQHGLAPSTTTAVMLAVGDAIALLASRLRGFSPSDFAKYHPGGALGRKLCSVDDVMRGMHECRVSSDELPVREAIAGKSPERRSGAVLLIDSTQRLSGIFTDSDLVKLLQRRQENSLDCPVRDVMTRTPVVIQSGTPLAEAVAILSERHISELPVVSKDGQPVGMIDITDLIAAGDLSTSDHGSAILPMNANQDEKPAS
ncbi:Arabinose 5-phosphate isomerase KpsF [Allorhodopirellula solitaria]|uniref:Arabinose 5-phosphate isomerase KpsF n=2 Tax=Allorhodopirellula solitaria TaxID=2527987 RepID=A0A5C5YFE2_9BACT|nr:Arabinose 5-phosphate isomerase KpsF [Allorhodopirellula solitaria]